MTAMLAFNDQQSLEENKASMTEMLDSVVSGQVTTAVRDTTIDDVEIKKDDFLGMIDGKIVVSEADRFNASLDRMIDEDTEIVTIIVGEDGSVEEAEKLIAILVSENDELETELHEGGQPVYPYLFSAE
jgi:dihydroxyacetone kinase-like predicted kinase